MTISVIIPTFNREKTIERSILSVLSQTHPINEIIIVDDCGSDNTKEIIDNLNNNIIKYVRLNNNQGPAHARNYGVSLASGDWIAFQDSDDEWHPNKIEKQLDYIHSHHGCRFVYSSYYNDNQKCDIPLYYNMERYEGTMLPTLLYRNTVGAPTILMEKSLFHEVNGFNTSMKALEDWDFAIKIAQKCPLGFISESLITVYHVDASISASIANYYQCKCLIIATYLSEYQKYNCFNEVLMGIYAEAMQDGVESYIEQLLTLYLTKGV